MNPITNKVISNLALFLFLFMSANTLCLALTTDRQKTMTFKSNKVYIDDKSGLSVYEGNVVVIQGSMKITADKLTVIYDAEQRLKKIIAEGQPSKFKQRPDNKDKDIEAIANKMVYFIKKDMLVLTNNALIKQGGNEFKSSKIFYHIKEDRVKTSRSKRDRTNGRVNIILDPAESTKK